MAACYCCATTPGGGGVGWLVVVLIDEGMYVYGNSLVSPCRVVDTLAHGLDPPHRIECVASVGHGRIECIPTAAGVAGQRQ